MFLTGVDPVHVVAEWYVNHGERKDQGRHEDDPRSGRVHLEPFGVQQGRDEIDRDADGQDETDDVLRHSRSTPRWMSPSRAKIATVTTVNTTTDMGRTFLGPATHISAPQ
jgi:hypothetical protein